MFLLKQSGPPSEQKGFGRKKLLQDRQSALHIIFIASLLLGEESVKNRRASLLLHYF